MIVEHGIHTNITSCRFRTLWFCILCILTGKKDTVHPVTGKSLCLVNILFVSRFIQTVTQKTEQINAVLSLDGKNSN